MRGLRARAGALPRPPALPVCPQSVPAPGAPELPWRGQGKHPRERSPEAGQRSPGLGSAGPLGAGFSPRRPPVGVFPAPPKRLGLFRARSSRLLTSACRWGNRRSFLKSVQKGRTARARLTHAFPEVGHALPPASCLGVLGLLGCSGGCSGVPEVVQWRGLPSSEAQPSSMRQQGWGELCWGLPW